MVPVLIGTAVTAFVYFGFPCHRYFPDGLSWAYELETSPDWNVHPHHPAFPLLPQVVYRMLGGESSGTTGLRLLTDWSTVFGILACMGMMLVLSAARLSTATILSGLGLFAFSAGIWWFSATPNQNSTPLALEILALLAMVLALEHSKKGLRAAHIVSIGLLTGVAIFASQINMLLLLPAGFVFLRNHTPMRRRIMSLIGYLAIVLVVSGALFVFLGVVLLGLRTPSDFLGWQHSYVYYPRWWASGPIDAITRTWRGAIELHIAGAFNAKGLFGDWRGILDSPQSLSLLILRIGQAVVLLFLAIESIRALIEWLRSRPRAAIQTLALLSALPVMLFTIVFMPDWVNYRVYYMPGLVLFLAPALERHFSLRLPTLRRSWPVVVVIIALFSANFFLKFLPASDPANNPYLYEARSLSEIIREGDLVVYSGAAQGSDRERYTRYFVRCDTILSQELAKRIRLHPDEVIDDFMVRHRAGGIVVIHEDVMDPDDVAWINDFYGTDIDPGELPEFFDTHAEIAGGFGLGGQVWFLVVPADLENLEPAVEERVRPFTMENG